MDWLEPSPRVQREPVRDALWQPAGILKIDPVVASNLHGRGTVVVIVAVNQQIDAQLNQGTFVKCASLFMLPAHFHLQGWINVGLLQPFQKLAPLLQEVSREDFALLSIDRRGDDRVRQKALRFSSEKEHCCYAGPLDFGRSNKESKFAQEHLERACSRFSEAQLA